MIQERIDPLITAAEDKVEGAKALAEQAAKDEAEDAGIVGDEDGLGGDEDAEAAEDVEHDEGEKTETGEDRFSDEL